MGALLGCSDKTVQRARLLMEGLGYATTVVAGRYLTTEERVAARLARRGAECVVIVVTGSSLFL